MNPRPNRGEDENSVNLRKKRDQVANPYLDSVDHFLFADEHEFCEESDSCGNSSSMPSTNPLPSDRTAKDLDKIFDDRSSTGFDSEVDEIESQALQSIADPPPESIADPPPTVRSRSASWVTASTSPSPASSTSAQEVADTPSSPDSEAVNQSMQDALFRLGIVSSLCLATVEI